MTDKRTLDIDKKEVIYQLPYPGLLPGHPLFLFKAIRDDILIFTTRDNFKKAKLYLHLSDKNISIALALINEGKEQGAIEQLRSAESRFLQIPPILQNIKDQGGEYSSEFILDLNQSNQKHKEAITEILSKVTEPEVKILNDLLDQNKKAEILLQNIK